MISLLASVVFAPITPLVTPLDWNDPDAMGAFLRAGAGGWSVSSTDPFVVALAAGAGARNANGSESAATFRNRFLTEGGALVVQIDANRPLAVVESGKTVMLDGQSISGVYRPERRNPALDLLAEIPTLPPIFTARPTEFQKRVRTLASSVPKGCTLNLRWKRPVIGLSSLKATGDAVAESEIRRFTQIWLRTEYGLRLSATWATPFGRFRQEALVYPQDPIRVYPTHGGLDFSPAGIQFKVVQSGVSSQLGMNGEFASGFRAGKPFDLTGCLDDRVVWLAESSEVREGRLGEAISGSDPVPVTITLPTLSATAIAVGMMVDDHLLVRKFSASKAIQFVVPAGNRRSIRWIKAGDAEIQPNEPLRMLVTVNFA